MQINGDRGRTRLGSRIFRRRQLPPGLAVAAALLLSSCHLMVSPKTGPEGRSVHDTDLRRLARDEAFAEALDLTDPDDKGAIGDELLRLMHRGLLLHYAGRYEESNELFQRAEAIIDDRYTKSVSLALLSVVTNDRALAWMPRDTERLMVNYYGALNYMALGDLEGAAVEARRLSYLLELAEDEELEEGEIEMHAILRYFAGSVFEASRERNDAAVAYRHVWSPADEFGRSPLNPRFLDLYGEGWVEEDLPDPEPVRTIDTVVDSILAARADTTRLPVQSDSLEVLAELELPEVPEIAEDPEAGDVPAPPDGPAPASPEGLDADVVADSPPAPPRPSLEPGGDVVVLLEKGFVAHRVERSRSIPVFPVEADALHSPSADVRFAAAACVASRAFQGRYDFSTILDESGTDWRGSGGKCIVPGAKGSGKNSGSSLYLMRVAWPEMVGSGLPTDLRVEGLAIAAGAGSLQMAALDSVPVAADAASDVLENDLVPATEESNVGPPDLDVLRMRPAMRGSVSGAVREEFEDQLGTILIKMVARTALKYELARSIEKELDKKDELLGDIAFLTANAAAAMFERADTRSWHLLPDELSIVRLRLPPGNHPLALEVETGDGGTRRIDLGRVRVRDGGVHVVSARVWP